VRQNLDLPPKLEDIINKGLEKDRNLRYQHASEIRTDLQRLKRTQSPVAKEYPTQRTAISSASSPLQRSGAAVSLPWHPLTCGH